MTNPTDTLPQRNSSSESSPGANSGPTLVERIKARLPLEKFARTHIELKTAGKDELVGLCPMHEDSSPSFHINTAKDVYHCKGCGGTGNVIHLFAFFQDLRYEDAKIALGKELGVYNERSIDSGESMLLNSARRFIDQLNRKDNALKYLDGRGLKRDTLEKFGVGFCWGREFMDMNEDMQKLAVTCGLMNEETKKSRLAGRITFPVRDRMGRVVGFGGRLVPSEDYVAHGPKYLNSPETPYFKKSELLYGLFEAGQGISKAGYAVAVEGYVDVLMLHQEQMDNAVGVMGASTSEAGFEQLWKVTKKIVFCLDPDAAGVKGTLRSVMTAAPTMEDGCQISIATIPNGQDPDEFVLQNGVAAFREICEQGLPLAKYLMLQKIHDYDLSCAEGRAALINEAKSISEIFVKAPEVAGQIMDAARALCAGSIVEATLRKIELPKVMDQREVELAIEMLQRLMPNAPKLSVKDRIAEARRSAAPRF